ncbi:MAG: hypothetical protein HYS24_04540 [Ignavibacteriales bacterium]|nr:hypothetical protein [Ignavibacteriales bacterium]MBK7981320.1 hypothetical protein [Ignavibacteriota bacterium]
MRQKILSLLFIGILSITFFNCSDVQDDITQTPVLEGVHPEGFGKLGSSNFHSATLQASNWDMVQCQKCHAADYSGGTADVSCLGCHSNSEGPEACNTCHGDFSNPSKIAPPTDLGNNIATTYKGVGAHSSHVYESELSNGYSCFTCHPSNVGSGKFVKAHIDGLPAEMSISGYSFTNYTCENNYCHGKFEFKKTDVDPEYAFIYKAEAITGENYTPNWTKVDGTQAPCGSCHLLPPRGHIFEGTDPEAETCASNNCHPSAFNADGTLNTLTHANGEKDLN